jgi:hypothetical protein
MFAAFYAIRGKAASVHPWTSPIGVLNVLLAECLCHHATIAVRGNNDLLGRERRGNWICLDSWIKNSQTVS